MVNNKHQTSAFDALDAFHSMRNHWIGLLGSNRSQAETYYFEHILEALVPLVQARLPDVEPFGGLISLLGYSPETTVLSCRVLTPKNLVILHTSETEKQLETVIRYCGLESANIQCLLFEHDHPHEDDIYRVFADALRRFGLEERIAVDLTGGKKTMSNQLAIAVGILRQLTSLQLALAYVDYDEYLPEFRKPEPASTHILLVDNPLDAPLKAFETFTTSSRPPPLTLRNVQIL